MSRRYRFKLTVTVEENHEAFDDPEWSPTLHGERLTNLYGLRCVYTDIETVEDSAAADL